MGVTVDLAAGTATGDGSDTLAHIRQVRGSSNADTLLGSDVTRYWETFEGRSGNDTIDGRGGVDIARYDNSPSGVVPYGSTPFLWQRCSSRWSPPRRAHEIERQTKARTRPHGFSWGKN